MQPDLASNKGPVSYGPDRPIATTLELPELTSFIPGTKAERILTGLNARRRVRNKGYTRVQGFDITPVVNLSLSREFTDVFGRQQGGGFSREATRRAKKNAQRSGRPSYEAYIARLLVTEAYFISGIDVKKVSEPNR